MAHAATHGTAQIVCLPWRFTFNLAANIGFVAIQSPRIDAPHQPYAAAADLRLRDIHRLKSQGKGVYNAVSNLKVKPYGLYDVVYKCLQTEKLLCEVSSNQEWQCAGIDRAEQYHTHIRIVDVYKILSIFMSKGMKLYPYLYPTELIPIGYLTGRSNITQVTYYYFTFIDSVLETRTWVFDLLKIGRHVDYNQCLTTEEIGAWDAQLLWPLSTNSTKIL
jgi:hypothetical protein